MQLLNRFKKYINPFSSKCIEFLKSLSTQASIMSDKEKEIVSMKKGLEDDAEGNDAKKLKIDEPKPFVRIKKRNFAVMLGYLGKNYHGMQRNPGTKTIEECLITAMLKAELINTEDFQVIQGIHFQRACRTDKGVSAVRQVCSLKLPENHEGDRKDSINKYLPSDIRVFGVKRVTKGFNSKGQCNARTYSYTMPTYALDDENLEHFHTMTGKIDDEIRIQERKRYLTGIDGKKLQNFKLPKEKWEKCNEILKRYEGTKNFHNYTTKMSFLDPSVRRYIMSFVAEEPFVSKGIEFITLKIKGQSFMMHQIRKMVSLAIAYTRGIIDIETFDNTFTNTKYDIPRAPSLGLMLNIVHYDNYNRRYGSDGVHEKLDWLECEEEVKEFEKNVIFENLFQDELDEDCMLNWLSYLKSESYKPRQEQIFADVTDNDKVQSEVLNES